MSFVWDYSIGILLIWFDQSNWESFFFWLNSRNWWWLQFFTFRLWWCVRVLINEDEKGWWTEVKSSKCARLEPHHKSLIDDFFYWLHSKPNHQQQKQIFPSGVMGNLKQKEIFKKNLTNDEGRWRRKLCRTIQPSSSKHHSKAGKSHTNQKEKKKMKYCPDRDTRKAMNNKNVCKQTNLTSSIVCGCLLKTRVWGGGQLRQMFFFHWIYC